MPDAQDLVGAKMAEFAVSSIATMARQNRRIPIAGSRPELGTKLDIERGFMIGIGVAVLCVHMLLLVAIVLVSQAPELHEPDEHPPGEQSSCNLAESQQELVRAQRGGSSYQSGSDDSN